MRCIDTADISLERGSAITIGNMDGVHKGHRRLIQETRKIALANDLASVVLTFWPHPSAVLRGCEVPMLLSREEQRRVMESLGLDVYIEYPFTKPFAAWPPERFFRSILGALCCRHLIIGEDFRFGGSGAGDRHTALSLGEAQGIYVQVMPPVSVGGDKISSSRIRVLIASRAFAEAEALLGRPYGISGQVAEGQKRGRTLGFPTLNLPVPEGKLVPPDGVYITNTIWNGKAYPGVTSIGDNPTFQGALRVVETHLPNFCGNLYREPVEVQFVRFVREKQKFASGEALAAAIAGDVRHLLATTE